jgi:hypothetical protein
MSIPLNEAKAHYMRTLICKNFTNEITDLEAGELLAWMKEHPDNETAVHLVHALLLASEKLSNKPIDILSSGGSEAMWQRAMKMLETQRPERANRRMYTHLIYAEGLPTSVELTELVFSTFIDTLDPTFGWADDQDEDSAGAPYLWLSWLTYDESDGVKGLASLKALAAIRNVELQACSVVTQDTMHLIINNMIK